MNKPTYVPNCTYRACLNQKTGAVGHATTYSYDGQYTWHACGSCAKKMAIKHGLEGDPKASKKKAAKRKPSSIQGSFA